MLFASARAARTALKNNSQLVRQLSERRRGAGPEGRCIPRSQVYEVSAPVIVRGYGVPKDATPGGPRLI
jgi:hypothetical protein